MIQICAYLYSSNFTPQVKEARNQSQIFNRKSISRNTTHRQSYCCNLSGGVALIVWFTTNEMCVKSNTIICAAQASNSKRDCDVVALPILTCERLNMMTSIHEERLRAWSLLLLAATVQRFARMPLGISDRNTIILFKYNFGLGLRFFSIYGQGEGGQIAARGLNMASHSVLSGPTKQSVSIFIWNFLQLIRTNVSADCLVVRLG